MTQFFFKKSLTQNIEPTKTEDWYMDKSIFFWKPPKMKDYKIIYN